MPSIADALEELNDNAMTRKEQIKEYLLTIGNGEMNIPFDAGFECGVEWADSHPHWISVEDGLPPFTRWNNGQLNESEDVLAYNGHMVYIDRLVGGKIHWWVNSKSVTPTHWMPLPAPPMKGDQGND